MPDLPPRTTATARRSAPRSCFSSINMVTSTSRSEYHGSTVSLKRNLQQGYMLQYAYTFGRALDDADLAVGTSAFQDAADLGAEWAVAGYDATHKVSIVDLWEMPFFKGPGLVSRLHRRELVTLEEVQVQPGASLRILSAHRSPERFRLSAPAV